MSFFLGLVNFFDSFRCFDPVDGSFIVVSVLEFCDIVINVSLYCFSINSKISLQFSTRSP